MSNMMRFTTTILLLLQCFLVSDGFSPLPSFRRNEVTSHNPSTTKRDIFFIEPIEPIEPDDEDDDDDDDIDVDPYRDVASSEFFEDDDDAKKESSSALTTSFGSSASSAAATNLDWGGEYGKLSERIQESAAGGPTPSKALFRIMTSETPNQAIAGFLRSADPQVVTAMSGAVSSLLGGLSNPAKGIETIVKTTGDKIGNLCFQLQMTGYMFRNAEYVLALKELMNIKGGATLEDYKDAFNRLDTDNSGYIDTDEIEALLADVYDGQVPGFEIDSFMKFFDSNKDGRISWHEFEKGLGNISQQDAAGFVSKSISYMLPASNDMDDDDEDDIPELKPTISGQIEIELDDGKIIQVEANEYIESLKKEAEALKTALRQEMGISSSGMSPLGNSRAPTGEGIASYIASRKEDLQTLTESVQPEIMETMKMLVDFVLKGGNDKKKDVPREQIEMQIPGSALQQLALWQLVLGYKLREAEATGDYLKLLE